MKILIINNNTKHLDHLRSALAEHDIEVRNYHPGTDFSCNDKDLVVLSGGGGEGLEIHDEHKPGHLWYEDQMRFIQSCQKPIVGICMGFEVISRAFGAKVEKLSKGLEEFIEIKTTPAGKRVLAKAQLKQFEAHNWCVRKSPVEFDVLAESKTGIEIIKHKTRPILATQFHPEKGGTLKLQQLLAYI